MPALRTPDYSDDLDELANRFMLSQILFSAVRLGIFESLSVGAKDAEMLAKELRLSGRGTRMLADALCGIGLLEKVDRQYALTGASRGCLTSAGAESRRALLLHGAENYERWAHLAEAVKHGEPWRPPGHESDLTQSREFALAMADMGRRSAPKVVEQLTALNPRRMLDLGGGPGVYALTFAERMPNLEAVVFDRAVAVEVARELIGGAGLAGRVSAVAGDFFSDEAGDGYDLVFISNVVYM